MGDRSPPQGKATRDVGDTPVTAALNLVCSVYKLHNPNVKADVSMLAREGAPAHAVLKLCDLVAPDSEDSEVLLDNLARYVTCTVAGPRCRTLNC